MSRVWDIFSEELSKTVNEHLLAVHSFVLMSNHFHLIASTPNSNISNCMHQFMGRSSRRLTKEGNRINQTFAGRHYKTILHKQNYFLNAYKYNYRNPVTAKISDTVETYPYSTLRGLLNSCESRIPLVEDTTYLADPDGTLKWLNSKPDDKKLEGVRFALKRQYFKAKRDRLSGNPMIADDEIL
jgi:putative transposase